MREAENIRWWNKEEMECRKREGRCVGKKNALDLKLKLKKKNEREDSRSQRGRREGSQRKIKQQRGELCNVGKMEEDNTIKRV